MNTYEMLEALSVSKNVQCADIANRILAEKSTIKEELKYTGSFMTEVLNGNFKDAVRNADYENLKSLRNYLVNGVGMIEPDLSVLKEKANSIGWITF